MFAEHFLFLIPSICNIALYFVFREQVAPGEADSASLGGDTGIVSFVAPPGHPSLVLGPGTYPGGDIIVEFEAGPEVEGGVRATGIR